MGLMRRARATGGNRAIAAAVLVGAAALSAPVASARAGDRNEGRDAAAESLFQDGRKLMEAKKYGEACPKFLASEKLSPALGTLLNLADCYEKNGQLASAWSRFHEAIAVAQRQRRPDREKTARDHADRLEARLVRLTIVSRDRGVDVTLDGNALDAAALGTPIPVDPGKHTIAASAKDKKPFTTTIDVSERSRSPSVEIPSLEDAPRETADGPANKHDGDDGRRGDAWRGGAGPGESAGGTQRVLGISAMGLGVVGLGVGAFFGLRTSSKWADAKTHCAGLECDRAGVDLATQAKNSGTASTIAFIAGGVFAVGGAALFFTAPSGEPRGEPSAAAREPARVRVGVGVGPGSVAIEGRF
jgi:hypothetical protein